MLITVKCKVCKDQWPFRDIKQHEVTCRKPIMTETVSTPDRGTTIINIITCRIHLPT